MGESIPVQNEQTEAVPSGYDREAVHEAAREELNQMLIEVGEENVELLNKVPENMKTVATLEILRAKLDSPETDNSLRHVAEIALPEMMSDEQSKISYKDFMTYQMVYQAMVLNPEATADTLAA